MKVMDIMNREVMTCRPQDSLNQAARLMWERDVRSLPVVADDGRPVGMITEQIRNGGSTPEVVQKSRRDAALALGLWRAGDSRPTKAHEWPERSTPGGRCRCVLECALTSRVVGNSRGRKLGMVRGQRSGARRALVASLDVAATIRTRTASSPHATSSTETALACRRGSPTAHFEVAIWGRCKPRRRCDVCGTFVDRA